VIVGLRLNLRQAVPWELIEHRVDAACCFVTDNATF